MSLSAFAQLFSELIQYQTIKVHSANDLEEKLATLGRTVGSRILELISNRDRLTKRADSVTGMLQFISADVWKIICGKVVDSLEKSTENMDECAFILVYPAKYERIDMVFDAEPIITRFISVPHHLGYLNCAAYMAGMIVGMMERARFNAHINAHTIRSAPGFADKTVFLITVNIGNNGSKKGD